MFVVFESLAHFFLFYFRITNCFFVLLSGKEVLHNDGVLVSLLTTINKLFTCLGHFLSPHVEDFLAKVSDYVMMNFTDKKNGVVESILLFCILA